jgi:peroxiredoxin
MNRICWRLVEILSRALEPAEREAVRGDIAESGATGAQALRDVFGLVVHRQSSLWVVIPLGMLLIFIAQFTADGSAVYLWMYANNWDWSFLGNALFRYDFPRFMAEAALSYFRLMCWSWTGGFLIGTLSRGAIQVSGALFCLVLLVAQVLRLPQHIVYLVFALFVRAARDNFNPNSAVFALPFYRIVFPLIVVAALVVIPSVWGMREGLRAVGFRPVLRFLTQAAGFATFAIIAIEVGIRFWFPRGGSMMRLLQLFVYWPAVYWTARAMGWHRRARIAIRASAITVILASFVAVADQPHVQVALQSLGERKPALNFTLQDASGKAMKLTDYRGKVVLLDFWATWCGGCKQEIPWFVEFERTYGGKGFAVVGVSLDEGGWNVLKPFLAVNNVPYRMLLGNDAIARQYEIKNMPDTFLIDRHGRVAAAYRAGLVDRANVQANLTALLAER